MKAIQWKNSDQFSIKRTTISYTSREIFWFAASGFQLKSAEFHLESYQRSGLCNETEIWAINCLEEPCSSDPQMVKFHLVGKCVEIFKIFEDDFSPQYRKFQDAATLIEERGSCLFTVRGVKQCILCAFLRAPTKYATRRSLRRMTAEGMCCLHALDASCMRTSPPRSCNAGKEHKVGTTPAK